MDVRSVGQFHERVVTLLYQPVVSPSEDDAFHWRAYALCLGSLLQVVCREGIAHGAEERGVVPGFGHLEQAGFPVLRK